MKDKSNEVFFVEAPRNQKESDVYANILAMGNFPAGLDGCFTVGISGGCGVNCFVYQDGECKEPEEFIENKYKEMSKEEIEQFKELYPQCQELVEVLNDSKKR